MEIIKKTKRSQFKNKEGILCSEIKGSTTIESTEFYSEAPFPNYQGYENAYVLQKTVSENAFLNDLKKHKLKSVENYESFLRKIHVSQLNSKLDYYPKDEWDALTLVGDSNFDLIADVDIEPNFDFLGSIQPSGTYTFANPFDLGVKFPITLEKKFVTRGFFPDDLIDHRTTLMDTWTTFDGDVVNNVNAILEVRTTDGDPTDASATWGDWNEFQKEEN